ncbi:hypothetical protein JL722_13586 [Aureococcus anophagefferens]|nr:hypothetical protein JL722_13586 [Aureococcus anophagefferens]
MAALTAAKTELVLIDYDDLVNARNDADTAQKIKFAFGKDGLGVLAVTNVPQELRDQRLRLLGIARRLGTLPEETLAKYENPDLHYCAGWSRGREKFKGKVDTAKGSWYANGLHEDAANGDADLKARYPESTTEPAWPDAEVGDDMRGAFRSFSRSLYDLSRHVLRHCDAAVASAVAAKGFASDARLTAATHGGAAPRRPPAPLLPARRRAVGRRRGLVRLAQRQQRHHGPGAGDLLRRR